MTQTTQQRTFKKETAIFDGRALRSARTSFERGIAYFLLAVSFASAMLACNGLTWPPNPIAIIGGITIQLVMTGIQWMYQPGRDGVRWYEVWLFQWQYITAVVIGAGTTVAAISIILLRPLAQLFNQIERLQPIGPLSLPYSVLAAWGILIILGVLIEVVPENTLVE